MKINIFVDMDGVLAVYDNDVVEKMYNEGFFLNRPVQKGNLKLVKNLIEDKDVNVYILSSLLADSEFILDEKNKWLDKYLPELPVNNRIFVPEGMPKSTFIETHLKGIKKSTNVLIDDYTVNLIKWKEDGYIALKMLNGLNNTNGIWLSRNPDSYLSYKANPNHNYKKLTKIIQNYCN